MTGLALSRSGAMPILDVEGMLQRLPAKARAELAWVQKPIRDAVERLARESVDPNLLDAVAREVTEPICRLGLAFRNVVAANPDEWRAAFMQELAREQDALQRFLEDPEAIDTLDWVIGFVRSLFTTGLSVTGVELPTEEAEAGLREVAASRTGLQMARGQLALMAAVSVANVQGSPERATELLDLSFLNLIELQSELRHVGYHVTPFPNETTEQRRARTLTAARFLRDGLSEDDLDVLEDARLRNLR